MGVVRLSTAGIVNYKKYSNMLADSISKYWLGILSTTENIRANDGVGFSNGDLMLAGTRSAGTFPTRSFATRITALGESTWQSQLSLDCNLQKAILDGSDNIRGVGQSRGTGNAGNLEPAFFRWASDGTGSVILKGGTLNSAGASDLSIDSSNNYYIISTTNDVLPARTQISKFDSTFTLVWQRQLDSNGSNKRNRPRGIATNSTGTSFVTYADDDGRYYYARIDTSGTLLGTRQLPNTHSVSGAAFDSSGNGYFVATASAGFVFKTDSSFAITAQVQIGSASTSFSRIFIDASNNIYVLGLTGTSFVIIKLDTSLSVVWQRTITNASEVGNVRVRPDGDLIVTGTVSTTGLLRGFVAYLATNGSSVGQAALDGVTFEIAASSLSVTTPTVTVTNPSFSSFSASQAWAAQTHTSSNPSYTITKKNL